MVSNKKLEDGSFLYEWLPSDVELEESETPLTFELYSDWVEQVTDFDSPTYAVLGLGGESGEVVEAVKKLHRSYGDAWSTRAEYNELDTVALEMGDVLWYISRLASALGYSLSDIAEMNMEKLNARRRRRV